MLLLYRNTSFISSASQELLDSRSGSSRNIYLPRQVTFIQIKRTYSDGLNSGKKYCEDQVDG